MGKGRRKGGGSALALTASCLSQYLLRLTATQPTAHLSTQTKVRLVFVGIKVY